MFHGLRQRLYGAQREAGRGQVRDELHGEVPEDEPKDLAALPGVPNGGQRTGRSAGTEDRTSTGQFIKRCLLYKTMG